MLNVKCLLEYWFLSFAALHTEGAEGGGEDGDDEFDDILDSFFVLHDVEWWNVKCYEGSLGKQAVQTPVQESIVILNY